MRSIRLFTSPARHAALAATALALTLGCAATAAAQESQWRRHHEHHGDERPLVLKDQGMFFVGGDIVHTDVAIGPNSPFTPFGAGDIAVHQMYVTFMVPEHERGVPIILMHGGNLSGACFETTPDGRMGWYEYFTRKGHAVYLPDQVARARSGFDVRPFNEVAFGTRPLSELPTLFVASEQLSWEIFRFGPTFGTPFQDEQFPVEAADVFAKQSVPDQNPELHIPPSDTNRNPARLAELADTIGGAVLLGHSESGLYPLQAALHDPSGLRGLIVTEPGSCNAATFSSAEIAKLAKIPTLVVFGDHLGDVPKSVVDWPAALSDCQRYVRKINDAGGDATMLHLPEAGVFGNSHMFFQDKNNLQVGNMVLAWIDEHVEGGKHHAGGGDHGDDDDHGQ
jgi:pimeloyl-ACP methyl ester carboxylesterase